MEQIEVRDARELEEYKYDWEQQQVFECAHRAYAPDMPVEIFITNYPMIMERISNKDYIYLKEITTIEEYGKTLYADVVPEELKEYIDWTQFGEDNRDTDIINEYGMVTWYEDPPMV